METLNISKYEAEYTRRLADNQPVEAIYQAEQMQAELGREPHDTVFHRFMYEYVGDAVDSPRAPLMIDYHDECGVVRYPNRMFFGFTDTSKLLLVRGSSDVAFNRPEQLYIATADLLAEQVKTWQVTEFVERQENSIELYMKDDEQQEAYLVMNTQQILLQTPGSRRPERVAPIYRQFFELLDMRRRLGQATVVGRLLLFMASLGVSQEPSEPTPATLVR